MLSGTQKLQAIYDSEQNATITWFWDGGIHATKSCEGFTNSKWG